VLLIPPGRHDEQPEILRRIRSGERIEHYETVRQRKDGGLVEVSMGVSGVRDETGDVVGASMIARDFGALRKAQKQQALLIDELRHRVKNTLATVQSIATQTFTRAPHDQRATFSARLHALAKAHDLLARRNWNQASITDVVSQALEPFHQKARDRIAFEGPDVLLAANKALSLAMALHELATNAAKYGALSNDAGKIRIHWDIAGHAEHFYVCLRLIWREQGGPTVKRPSRKGFGTFLIERIMEGDGETALSFEPAGVVATMSIAL
jgi:two-component sensor histidine kinase